MERPRPGELTLYREVMHVVDKARNTDKLYIGDDITAELLTKEAAHGQQTIVDPHHGITLRAKIPLNYFDALGISLNEKETEQLISFLVQYNQFTQRSVLAQSGAAIQYNGKLGAIVAETHRDQDNILVNYVLRNHNPTAYFIIPPEIKFGRLLMQPYPLEGNALIQAAYDSFPGQQIHLIGRDQQMYPLSEALHWNSADTRLTGEHRVNAVAVPVIRSGISTAGHIDFRTLVSRRDELDKQLGIHWDPLYVPNYAQAPIVKLADTVPVTLPTNIAALIITGVRDDEYHALSTYITPGFGGVKYNDYTFKNGHPGEVGTRIRLEFEMFHARYQVPSTVWMHLMPA
jgi:hypothetical protein